MDRARQIITQEAMRANFEKALVGFGLLTPTSVAPQLYKIWVLKHVAGYSSVTLSTALFMSLMWTMYGLIEQRKSLYAVNGVWVAINGATLAGVLVNS